MNTHVDQTQEKKGQFDADNLSQQESGGQSVSNFMANRPEVVAIDTLQRMENGSPRVRQLKAFQDRADSRAAQQLRPIQKKENGSLGNGEPVVQRVINVDGVSYTAEARELFEGIYDLAHRAEMVTALADFEQAPQDIGAALADPRTFPMTFEDLSEFGPGLFAYNVNLDEVPALVTAVDGGFTRSAGARPELVTRPEAGFEQINISGLIMCVGIVIEAFDDGGTNAAVGAHFVTPEEIEEQSLNARGTWQLNKMLELINGFGGQLSATLCYLPGQNGGPRADTALALDLITAYLTERNVTGIQVLKTGDSFRYQLSSDGIPDLT